MILNKGVSHIGEFTKIPLNLFFAIGICFVRWHPKEKSRRLQLFFMALAFLNIGLGATSLLLYSVFAPLDTSLEKTAYIIYTTFSGSSFIKLGCTLLNIKNLRLVLKNFEKYYPKTIQQSREYNLDEHLYTIHRYNMGLTIYHFCVTSMFNLFPLIQCIYLYWENAESSFLYDLPFPMVYAFDSRRPWTYAFAYVTQCGASYSLSCMFLGSDLLLVTCVHLINMNFKYLAKSIREFKPTGTLKDLEELEYFISYHSDILRTVQLVDKCFNIAIFLNYMGTATIICLIGFQLVAGTNFLDLVKFLSFLISVLTHVYFISIFGTDMMTLSFDISEAFMHHAWYDAHKEYRRALPLTIARAQKPVHLNAFKFFIISMETFKSLVSVSYQFFTLIKTSYEEE